ncbi:MAG: TIGR03087 family PEP-CTERM/XrtA system glycosyltransferase [Planctomycetes bacterium]|nr:TIGR03087 family PEP-CTERM/XrtA system glycosyltransferase [Planctomycetota bacterium]
MARILFLPHRLPFPPDKGDKIRSYHLLEHLAARHEVTLATFVDDPADEAHLPAVRARCADAAFARLSPFGGRLRSLAALPTRSPMTPAYYHDDGLRRQVQAFARQRRFDAALVFSSSMVPYAQAAQAAQAPAPLPMLLDLVDVDSAKWAAYAERRPWPLSWPLAREGRTLLAYERQAVAQASASFLCTEQERDLFHHLAPECAGRVDVMRNGVDAAFYSPDPARASPFAAGEKTVVFTGAMDYWPNVDAVVWFVREMLVPLRQRVPGVRFCIVGRSPAPAVRQLAADTVVVTGTVADVRPYLQHATAVVAPLRVARGIQNKILEAMAMGRPVVAARSCAAALDGTAALAGEAPPLLTADDAPGYVAALERLLTEPARAAAIGEAGRRLVLAAYSWAGSLRVLDERLAEATAPRAAPRRGAVLPANMAALPATVDEA